VSRECGIPAHRGLVTMGMRAILIGVAVCVMLAVLVYAISGGNVFFLPLVLLLPFGFTLGRRRSP
jgi:hypothetical protein